MVLTSYSYFYVSHQINLKTRYSKSILYFLLYIYIFILITKWHRYREDIDTIIYNIYIARNDRWFAYLHIQNGGSKIIWILTYSWTGNFLLAWAGLIAGIENQSMHRFEQYLKILQLYHENSRFPPSFKL